MSYHKYALTCTKVLRFLELTFPLKFLGIGSSENYWGDVKTIKSGKKSAISSDV